MTFRHETPPMRDYLTVRPSDHHTGGSTIIAGNVSHWLTRDEALALAEELRTNADFPEPNVHEVTVEPATQHFHRIETPIHGYSATCTCGWTTWDRDKGAVLVEKAHHQHNARKTA